LAQIPKMTMRKNILRFAIVVEKSFLLMNWRNVLLLGRKGNMARRISIGFARNAVRTLMIGRAVRWM